jgi:phosphopantothenoylcysteine decarboxylase/phosphopantothenate--cysteine ligase
MGTKDNRHFTSKIYAPMNTYPATNLLIGASGSAGIQEIASRIKWFRSAGVTTIDVALSRSAFSILSEEGISNLGANSIFVDGQQTVQSKNDVPIHMTLTKERHAILMMPTTANLLGKIANGIADTLLSTLVLAASCPVLIVPCMNNIMWTKPSVQRNVRILRDDKYVVFDPQLGKSLATGENELGCMADVLMVSTVMASLIFKAQGIHKSRIC